MLLRHVLAILILPFTVTVVVPAALLARDGAHAPLLSRLGGVLLALAGLFLVIRTIGYFATRGRGTLAPWDPPRHLVVSGIYRRVRNPMISGVLLILAGEALWFSSAPLALWFGAVFAINALYIPLVEEPMLRRRFGAEYETYARNVPRWVPRSSPWQPE
jgi:protein-S-isoprenylcysteine O-methyltransferase Ste14